MKIIREVSFVNDFRRLTASGTQFHSCRPILDSNSSQTSVCFHFCDDVPSCEQSSSPELVLEPYTVELDTPEENTEPIEDTPETQPTEAPEETEPTETSEEAAPAELPKEPEPAEETQESEAADLQAEETAPQETEAPTEP